MGVGVIAFRLLRPSWEAIGATGRIGAQTLRKLGGVSQNYFPTSQGARYVDQLVGDIAHESKVGYQTLTDTISRQIGKGAQLLASGRVDAVSWDFFRSPVTGLRGPSAMLRSALEEKGISVKLW